MRVTAEADVLERTI